MRLHIYLPDQFEDAIKEARGDVTASLWIRRAIEAHLERAGVPIPDLSKPVPKPDAPPMLVPKTTRQRSPRRRPKEPR